MKASRGFKRLWLAALVFWVAFWSWQYGTARYAARNAQNDINKRMAEIDRMTSSNYSSAEFLRLDGFNRESMGIRDNNDALAEQALRTGLIGLVCIIILGGAAVWVWRGFSPSSNRGVK